MNNTTIAPTLLIAHRGESYDAPENTLAAVNLAWERGASAVEIDIQLTKDAELVVIHDADTRRISGVKKIIKNSSLLELRKLDYGAHKDEKWTHEPIPLLKEVLQTVPAHGKLIIEIKSDDKILPYLKTELDDSGLKNSQIELIDFNVRTLGKAKQLMPEFSMLWLLDLDYSLPHWMTLVSKKRIIKKVKKLNLDGVNVWAGKLLNDHFIKVFHQADLAIYCWTVNDPAQAQALIENGIDGLTSDRPSWIIEQLTKFESFQRR